MQKLDLHLFCYLALLAITLTTLTTAAETHWGYPDLDVGEEFDGWGGLCDSGTRQSPIDLSIGQSLKGFFEKLDFEHYNDKQSGVMMVNNGHTIQLSGFSSQMELEGGPLLGEYVVEQIHMHWWSEHTIENIRYPLEVHIVHRNKRYPNVTMAANYKDGLTVVAVLYHVSNERNEAIELILDNLDGVKGAEQINKPVPMKQPFTVRNLFPTMNGYMTYAGSLTTPSCAEAVTWIVLSETFPVKLDQIERLKGIEYADGKQLHNNYRTLQKSNNRPVVLVTDDVRGAASVLHVSLGLLPLFVVISKFLQ